MTNSSLELKASLREELFFIMNYFTMGREEALRIPIEERKWLMQRFIEQKEKENAAIEASRKKGKNK